MKLRYKVAIILSPIFIATLFFLFLLLRLEANRQIEIIEKVVTIETKSTPEVIIIQVTEEPQPEPYPYEGRSGTSQIDLFMGYFCFNGEYVLTSPQCNRVDKNQDGEIDIIDLQTIASKYVAYDESEVQYATTVCFEVSPMPENCRHWDANGNNIIDLDDSTLASAWIDTSVLSQ